MVVGQTAHACSDVQDSYGVVAGRGEGDESSQDHRRVGVRLPDPAGRRAGSTEKGHTGLASYYTQRGETPGVWVGTEMAGIEGLDSRSKLWNIHIRHTGQSQAARVPAVAPARQHHRSEFSKGGGS